MNKEGALSGIKVIDLTRVISGPFCTLLLANNKVQKGPDITLVKSITLIPDNAPSLFIN